MEKSRTQPDELSSRQEERVVSEPVEPARNGERLNRDLSEEPQVRDTPRASPKQEKEPREQERRVTKIKGKVPSKFTPWGMAAGQGSPKRE